MPIACVNGSNLYPVDKLLEGFSPISPIALPSLTTLDIDGPATVAMAPTALGSLWNRG